MYNTNVIPIILKKKIQKGQFLLPFFFIYTKIISDEGMMKNYFFVFFLSQPIVPYSGLNLFIQ